MAADGLSIQLGLPTPIKVTAVAPTGTIAQLRGTTSGMHPVYARFFIRRVQYADHDPNLAEMEAKGYHVEDSVYAAHTKVVEIPVKDIILNRHPEALIEQADEVNVDQFLSVQAALQSTFCGGMDGQAISATANIPASGTDVDLLSDTLRKHLPYLKGATVFPAVSRPQTPIQAITKDEWAIMILDLSFPELVEAGDSNDGECVSGACPIR
jgi:ribonucleotide reductase alpha subunit